MPHRPSPAAGPPGPEGTPTTTGFFEVLRSRERGRLKVYIGSAAGTGKTYRMLQEAHELRRRGIDVVVGFVETHGRVETEAQLGELEVLPRRGIAYRGVALDEMDLDRLLARRPQVAIVDELAHTNVPGSAHRKRWQDVLTLLDEGISVISAVNVQHLESLNDVLQRTLGITVRETVPDWVVAGADQVVNLDISAEDLRQRLQDGKIYHPAKVQAALANFFTDENLTTLRELALREVANSVDRSREEIVRREEGTSGEVRPVERLLVAMTSNAKVTRRLLRKGSRIAGRLNSDWTCLWVETPAERPDRIDATRQRLLVDNIQLAQVLGAEYLKVPGEDVAATILAVARDRGATLVVVGQSRARWWQRMRGTLADRLVRNRAGFDVLVVASESVTVAPRGTP